MDLGVIFARDPDNVVENSTSGDIVPPQHGSTENFLRNNRLVVIPYLCSTILASIIGTIGNTLIICSVLTNKVNPHLG